MSLSRSDGAARGVGFRGWLALAALVAGLDQLSKALAETMLKPGRPLPVVRPVFDLLLSYNEGAAFSVLSDAGGWQRYLFVALAVVVSVILVVWLRRLAAHERATGLALALVLGGAVGNLVDRVFRDGRVVDFLYFHYGSFHWPAFNLADSAISVGAVVLVLETLRAKPG